MENENKDIIKCLKSFLTGKKYIDTDDDKSYEYFKQCIFLLNNIKENTKNLPDKIVDIMNETETECSKYLSESITKTIEKPYNKRISNNLNEIFNIIDMGEVDKLKKYNYGEIDYMVYNDNGLSPLHYAIQVGDTTFIKMLFKLGAPVDITNKNGHTLLEFACLEKDPNMINFITDYGADMKKHLLFREGKKYNNYGNMIDIVLLEKIIMETEDKKYIKKLKYLDFIFTSNLLDKNVTLDIECNNIMVTIDMLIQKLDILIGTFEANYRDTYISILKEELSYNLQFKLGCPTNKIEILLYNLAPFINYDHLRLNWLLSLEIKYIIIKILKNKIKINPKALKSELTDKLYESYIKNNIIPEGLINIIVQQWINKIKV